MNNIKDLIKALKSETFHEAAEKVYNFLIYDKEESKVSLDEYVSALRGLFIDNYITAKNQEEMYYIIKSAIDANVYAVDADSIFKVLATTKAKPGEVVELNYFKESIDVIEYRYEPLYEELSKYNDIIARIIKNDQCFYTISQIKRGNYNGPRDYRISQKEIRTIENVKMIGPINRIIHDLYDVTGAIFNYCEYSDIPKDSVLRRFAFHTNKANPLFKIIFEDGTIVEYLEGDLRVLAYKFQDLLKLTKLHMVQDLQHNDIYDIDLLDEKSFILETVMASNRSKGILNTLEDVYTKRMIEASKRELEGIKELVKEYNL